MIALLDGNIIQMHINKVNVAIIYACMHLFENANNFYIKLSGLFLSRGSLYTSIHYTPRRNTSKTHHSTPIHTYIYNTWPVYTVRRCFNVYIIIMSSCNKINVDVYIASIYHSHNNSFIANVKKL